MYFDMGIIYGNWGAIFEASRKEQGMKKIELQVRTQIPRSTLRRILSGERDSLITITEFQRLTTILKLHV